MTDEERIKTEEDVRHAEFAEQTRVDLELREARKKAAQEAADAAEMNRARHEARSAAIRDAIEAKKEQES